MSITQKEKKLIKITREKLATGEVIRGHAGVNPKNLAETLKKRICSQMNTYKQENDLSNEDLVNLLDMTETQVIKLLAYHIDFFSLDFLMDKLEKLSKHSQEAKSRVERLKVA